MSKCWDEMSLAFYCSNLERNCRSPKPLNIPEVLPFLFFHRPALRLHNDLGCWCPAAGCKSQRSGSCTWWRTERGSHQFTRAHSMLCLLIPLPVTSEPQQVLDIYFSNLEHNCRSPKSLNIPDVLLFLFFHRTALHLHNDHGFIHCLIYRPTQMSSMHQDTHGPTCTCCNRDHAQNTAGAQCLPGYQSWV